MINFHRNNLDRSTSPYLQQHKNNPVFWQEWKKETLEYAEKTGKIIFVSIGYATCRWCHVMAKEAFSKPEVATMLNNNFVAIKVDREQRPDLDQYFIEYVTETQNQPGWPLNVFLSPDLKPFFSGTYFPDRPKYGLPSFQYVLEEALRWYTQNQHQLQPFTIDYSKKFQNSLNESDLIDIIENEFDIEWAGFEGEHKFPPHNTLLFLLYNYAKTKNINLRSMIVNTLESMAQYGLHDHVQGGFFRYCTDKSWTTPHFEKMLYDQAMHLWTYAAAYKVFGKSTYKTLVEKIVQCLEETFEQDGLYFAALDAETDGREGETYLWREQELKAILTSSELKKFFTLYNLIPGENFGGKKHLTKKEEDFLPDIEKKLLQYRKEKPQPFIDKKIITSWNALVGIGLMMAYRFSGLENCLEKAKITFEKLIEKHYLDGRLHHSSLNDVIQKEDFLEDYAGLLLLATFLEEELGGYQSLILEFLDKMNTFYQNGVWYTNAKTQDFFKIPAQQFDHPTPSAVSLAEFAKLRAELLTGKRPEIPLAFHLPLENDFYNMVAASTQGSWHEIHTPEKLYWKELPLNCLQIKDIHFEDCFEQTCRPFAKKEALLVYLKESLAIS